jgi:glutathione peroxidase
MVRTILLLIPAASGVEPGNDTLKTGASMRTAFVIGLCGLAFVSLIHVSSVQSQEPPVNCLQHEVKTIDGKPVSLEQYQGQVLLVVNVASKCGLTPQYKALQALHEKYRDQGLRILGFPCNQFLGQEPGDESQIKTFCQTKYGVEFDLFSKVAVNGDEACELYKQLTSLEVPPAGSGPISWNFEKFVVDRQGNVVGRFSPRTSPDDAELVALIEKLLAADAG